MTWNNPFSPERVRHILAFGDLQPGQLVLDAGCGAGELFDLLPDGVQGLGVDLDGSLIESATPREHVTLHAGDAASFSWPDAQMAVCIGSTHAFGEDSLSGTIHTLGARAPWLLLGLGFHRPPMPPGYADFMGTPSGIENTHLENVHAIEALGFEVRHAITATEAEWDTFEWGFYRRKEKRAWRDAYLRWGRQTMGFGLYLARRASTEDLAP